MTVPPAQTKEALRQASTVGTMIYILFGPIVWAVHFLLLYGGQSMTCALAAMRAENAGANMITAVIWAPTTLALLMIVVSVLAPEALRRGLRAGQSNGHMYRRTMVLLSLLSGFAIVAAALTSTMIASCAALR